MARKSAAAAHALVLRKAFKSAAFRRKLLKSPHKALESIGYPIPRGYRVKVHENGPKVTHIVLPSRPKVRKKPSGPKPPGQMGPGYTFI